MTEETNIYNETTEISEQDARAGRTGTGLRAVLVISTLGAIVVLALVAGMNGAAG